MMRWSPARTASAGAVILMACACGAGASSAKLLAMGGFPATSKLTHSLLLGVGVAAVLWGLARINRLALVLAATSFAVLGAAAALTPPNAMSAARLPWDGPRAAGGVLYLVFGALLGYAFWTALLSRGGRPAAAALFGTAVATGCSCCMVTGAIAGLAVTAGGAEDIFLRMPVVFFSGIAVTAGGLIRVGGWRTLPWLIAGAALTRYGGRGLQLIGDWNVGEVNLRFIPGYLVYLAGAALVIKAWAVAYEPAAVAEDVLAAEPVSASR